MDMKLSRVFIVCTFITLLAACLACSACKEKGGGPFALEYDHVLVDDKVTDDPAVEEYVSGFRKQIKEKAEKVIGKATASFVKGKPESTIGNLLTDIMRQSVAEKEGVTVHLAILNNGGIRAPIHKGPIKTADIFKRHMAGMQGPASDPNTAPKP